MLTKRTNILFDEQLWKRLVLLAQKQNTSVGKLVRTAVKKYYTKDDLVRQRKEIAQAIRIFRKKHVNNLARGEDSTSIIRRMRDTRYGN